MEHVTYSGDNQKIIERFLLFVYTIFSLVIYGLGVNQHWNIWSNIIIIACFMAAWTVHLTKVKTYEFRAFFSAIMMQCSLIVYGINVEEISTFLLTFYVFIVLFGSYGKPKIISSTLITAVFIFLYRGVILKNLQSADESQMLSYFTQLVTTLFLVYVVYIWTKRNSEGSQQLLNTIEELKIVERSKDDFVANVSHEIRTPINTICGMSEVLLREDLPYEIKESVQYIQTAGRNLTGVVRDILDFSELQSGKIELEEEAYNITSTVNDVINMALALKEEKNIELIVDCNANIPSVLLGDEKKLRRIIMNIISNGIKFTEEGCVSIRIGFRKEEYGINLIISVKDTGIGISEADLEKLFKGFTQVDASRKRQEGGLGLGLAITSVLVKKLGGALTIKSKVGKGTTVQIVVPQKVLDESPIAAINDRHNVNVAAYIDMEQFDVITIRDEYSNSIIHMVEQLRGKCHICRNLAELQRRESKERFSHIFISIVEYREDPAYFDELANKTNVIVILNRFEEKYINNPNLLKIYKPFYILTIVSVLNGLYDNTKNSGHGKHEKFVVKNGHVLVVDDNQMNLRVAEEILANYEIKVTTASSGKEALDKVTQAEYDFIFMDHMMPEMDGVETLRRIRHKIGTYYQKVPIIALTANAVAGTREMLLEEGFNDFLEKPIERSVLERILKRTLSSDKIIYRDVATDDNPDETCDGETFEIEDLDVQKGILYCGGQEQYIKILQGYCEDWENTGSGVEEAFKQADWKNYTIAVHGLKGALRTIGATQISEMARKLEYAGKENRIDYILKHHEELMNEYRRLFDKLSTNKYIYPAAQVIEDKEEKLQEENVPEIEEEEFDKKISEMETAMYTLDGEVLMEIITELQKYQYKGNSLQEILTPIKRKVEMCDYISAVESVVKWKSGLTE